tara:strand:+ start:245 stop:466 length:222 start_codon:yes stop_codon:yes gene_type:complete
MGLIVRRTAKSYFSLGNRFAFEMKSQVFLFYFEHNVLRFLISQEMRDLSTNAKELLMINVDSLGEVFANIKIL